MQRTCLGMALCAIMLLALLPAPVDAQDVPTPAGWEMGFVYENGASEDDPFPLDETETNIRFWIRNDNLIGDIEISLEYSIQDMIADQQLALDGEESVTVGSGSNDTFTLKITGIDVWDIASGVVFELEIDGEMTSFQGVPLAVPISSQSIDGELIVPELFRWEVDIVEIGHPINAGTEFNLHLDLVNKGNTPDSIRSFSVEDNCPVLTSEEDVEIKMADTPFDSILGLVTYPDQVWQGNVRSYGLAISVTVVFDASSTHPTRMCEIEITVQSTGVNNGGEGDASNKGEIDVEIEARPVGAQQDQNDASVGDDDGPQNQEQVTSDNFLMFPTLVTPIAILWAAFVRAREE
ncbi:MAG: hypothetical protein QF722_03740 [Candidatus Thalassarchaeaceae archaeon]|nr:hypothetical protein [Candidatus Thalassarchaeaceae archaeon]